MGSVQTLVKAVGYVAGGVGKLEKLVVKPVGLKYLGNGQEIAPCRRFNKLR
jgi:hypothetical protein